MESVGDTPSKFPCFSTQDLFFNERVQGEISCAIDVANNSQMTPQESALLAILTASSSLDMLFALEFRQKYSSEIRAACEAYYISSRIVHSVDKAVKSEKMTTVGFARVAA